LFVTRAKNKKNAKKNERIVVVCKFCLYLQKILKDMTQNSTKKRLVASFNNLSPELQEEIKAFYPKGFAEVMTRFDKPNGDFFYYVPFETEDTSYLVKIDVKIDDKAEEAVEEDYYGDDELKGADEIQDDASMDDDDM